ncbi:MAG: hypothetical protein WA280_09280 [Xanthobacteraceae bacterium]
MCRSKTERRRLARVLALAGVGILLAGCSDLFVLRQDASYLDRRDSIALSGGDAVAGNTINQMIDPWPAYSGDKNIAFNGQKMQTAVVRYRTGKVIEPTDPENVMSTNQQGQSISTTVNNGGGAPAAPTTPGQ